MNTLTEKEIERISKHDLISMIKSGNLIVMTQIPIEDVMEIELPEDFKHLSGIPIHLGAASRKYNIAHQTISRWVRSNLIPVVKRVSQKVYIDEAYMAWRADTYHKNPGQGKWLFDRESGAPYRKKAE